MATLLPEGKQSFNTSAGIPLVGGKLYTYDAGTSTPRATYQDAAGTTPNTNPVILDARGEATVFWSGAYKVVLKDASDVTIWTVDNVSGVSGADLVAATGAGLIGFSYAIGYVAGSIGKWLVDNVTRLVDLAAGTGSGLVGHQRDVGFPVNKLYAEARRALWVDEIYPSGFNPSTTDASAYINTVLLWAEANGNPEVRISGRRHCLSAQSVAIPDYVELIGQGRGKTELFLMNSANKELVVKKVGAGGIGAGLRRLSLNGNDTNNTSGGFFWNNTLVDRGPSIQIEEVLFNYMRASAASGVNGAVVIQGSTWGVMRDVDINQNQYAVGLWHKGSDWIFDDLFMGPNGANTPNQSVIIQGGAGNIFTAAYFGGNGGYEQVLLWGTQRNEFIGCLNDNAWQDGYRLIDNGGTASSNNNFIGGQISHAGGRTANTYSGVSLEGAATGNVFTGIQWIGDGHTSSLNKAAYAITEIGTATGNQVNGGWTGNNYGTKFNNLRAASTSVIRNVQGFNPQGVASITVGASPYTYTNQDSVSESVYITNGSVSSVVKNGSTVFTATNCNVQLDPGDTLTVTYSGLPTINKDRR